MKSEILIIGVGGEGVLTIGEILSEVFIKNNYNVSLYPFYGSQQRGGVVLCILKIDNMKKIINPTINSPDYYLVVNDKYLYEYEIYKNKNTKMIFAEDAEKNNKSKNMIILKKFIDDFKIINELDTVYEIKKKFKKIEVQQKNIDVFLKS